MLYLNEFYLFSDMEHILRRTLHHTVDGFLLNVHRFDLQRYFLQVIEFIWVSMEDELQFVDHNGEQVLTTQPIDGRLRLHAISNRY